jgi:hypothetical protein
MWELWSGCAIPYGHVTHDIQVVNFVSSGGRLERTTSCPIPVYDIMLRCWAHDRDERFVARALPSLP